MKAFFALITFVVAAALAPAQPPAPPAAGAAETAAEAPPAGPVVLDWTPPALAHLATEATTKSSFTLDRTMLAAAAGMLPDSEADTRQAIRKLDGVSVHLLRFGAGGIADQADVDAIRQAYHLRGWKHVATAAGSGGPVHDGTTDVWMVLDGVNMRGAVVLVQTPQSLSLVTVAGNLNPVDLLHLRGHFGIPRFNGDALKDTPR